MARRMSKEQIEEIVQRDMPGHRVVHRATAEDAGDVALSVDQGTPDIDELRRKFLGDERQAVHAMDDDIEFDGGASADAGDEQDFADEMVALQPADRSRPWDQGSKAKVVIISGKDQKIISSQG
jgi:hypothetical protein